VYNCAVARGSADTLKKVPLFAGLDDRELEAIAGSMRERKFSAGNTVTEEGAGGAGFFVVESGEAEVTVDGEPRGTIAAGDYFGEIALLNDSPRTATVTALQDVELRALDRNVFLATVTGHDGSSMAVEAIASRRLATARPVAVAG